MKHFIKKFIPKALVLLYHKLLAYLGAFFYRFPSSRLVVIGITGTKGKSTVTYLTAKILEQAGYRVGATATFFFKVAEREWINDTKQTMQGRFRLQKLLAEMVKAGCQYAVVETSSEGIMQHRHLGINYDVVVFTNLSPEHIEAHGGYAQYRTAKGKLFQNLHKGKKKHLLGKEIKKTIIVNLDDQEASYFLSFPSATQYGFTIEGRSLPSTTSIRNVVGRDMHADGYGVGFSVDDVSFSLPLLGTFNVYNVLTAVTVAVSQEIDLRTVKQALEQVRSIPGRLERIENNRGFTIFVDYAHEPRGLEEVYKTVRPLSAGKLISVLGSQGGGRDHAKRPVLGSLAAQYADQVIVTNEDPYDEDPERIIDDVLSGALKHGKILNKNCWKIVDRHEAIAKALALASRGDIILITGKGAERSMIIAGGKKAPWDDRDVVRELMGV